MLKISPAGDGVAFEVRVTPRSSRQEFSLAQGVLRVRLTAPPVEGRANKALLRYLAKILGVAPSRLSLLSGEKGRRKRVSVSGLRPEQVRRRLGL